MLVFQRPTVHFFIILFYIILIANDVTSKPDRESHLKGTIDRDNDRYKWIDYKVKSYTPHNTKRMSKAKETRRMTSTNDEPFVPISDRAGPPKSFINGSVIIPLEAAMKPFNVTQYVAEIEVGTPPRKHRFLVDTGSDLTWVKCKDEKSQFANERGFDPKLSSTFSQITCGDRRCRQIAEYYPVLDICPIPTAPCLFNFSYGVSSKQVGASGWLGKDMLTFQTNHGQKTVMENMLIGCTESFEGDIDLSKVDGLLGLGINPFSFSTIGVDMYGGTYSYCLVDHLSSLNKSSYLLFGKTIDQKAPTNEFPRYTALNYENSFVTVTIKGISLNDRMLDIPPIAWRAEKGNVGNTIVDSGTALTMWNDMVYRPLMDAIIAAIQKDYPKLPPDQLGDGITDFEYCFDPRKHPFDKEKVPKLVIHFIDGGKFEPHPQNYIIDEGNGYRCIGFLWGRGAANIIGNIMQQNFLWEFDLHYKALGFFPSTCI